MRPIPTNLIEWHQSQPRGVFAKLAAPSLVVLAIVTGGMPGGCAAAHPPGANVLVVYTQNRLLPANIEFDRGLQEATEGGTIRDVHFFAEFLDSPQTGGEVYEVRTAAYLKEKYAGRPPQVVVSAGTEALSFLLRHRSEMFPGVPIVHAASNRRILKTLQLPADVIGIPADYDMQGTIELALHLQPNARRLVIVTGASRWSQRRQTEIRQDLETHPPGLPVEFLAGLSTTEVAAHLATLTRDTIVFTPGYFVDGAERTMTPRESVATMAATSGAPMYVPFTSQIGTGAVGGRMATFVEMGRQARIIVDRLLEGMPAVSVAVPSAIPTSVHVDWRQLRRWDIAPNLLPPDAIIHFREPTYWEAHRTQITIVAAVMLAQAVLIIALLLERGRRRRTAAALAESEQHIRLAAQAARLSTFAWNLARGRSTGNAGLDKPTGRPQRPDSFEDVLQSVHPVDRDRFDLAARSAAANRTQLDVEYRSIQPDGEVLWFAARGQPATDDSDTLSGVKMDITPRKTAELQVEADRAAMSHMSRVATMGQLSAAIAHQLNQPLAAILGNAETARKMLGRKGSSPEELREIVDDIIAENNRAAEVIRRLGALYRRGEIELSALDLNALVRETVDLLRSELALRKVVPILELADSLPPVQGNRIHLQQVLMNLVLNATDAMHAVDDPSLRTVTLRTSSDGEQARVCVVDRGTGIAPGDLPRTFDAFWTTKANGVGVGLAICKTIIESHHGTLTAENNSEGGATFCFTLPMAASD